MRKSLITKKAINELVKAKDTETIIKLYELEQKQNPFDAYALRENCNYLTPIQKTVIKENLEKGKTFGLDKELFFNLKEAVGLGRIVHKLIGETLKTLFIDDRTQKVIEL